MCLNGFRVAGEVTRKTWLHIHTLYKVINAGLDRLVASLDILNRLSCVPGNFFIRLN